MGWGSQAPMICILHHECAALAAAAGLLWRLGAVVRRSRWDVVSHHAGRSPGFTAKHWQPQQGCSMAAAGEEGGLMKAANTANRCLNDWTEHTAAGPS